MSTIKQIFTPIVVIFILFTSLSYSHYHQKISKSGHYYILDFNNTLKSIKELQKEGLTLKDIDAPLIDYIFGKPKEGWIYLTKSNTILDAIKKIGSNRREKTKKILFYSSDTIDDFGRYFCKLNNTDIATLKRVYNKYSHWREAGIVAKIYHIPYGVSTKQAIRYMIKKSDIIYQKIASKYRVKYPSKEFKRYLIIASIIQKESWIEEEMPKISAVIHNRLEKNMRLQMDATLNYGKYSHTIVTPYRIRSDKSKYNTYLHKGLPPEPLGSVTPQALEAAFNPSNEKYLYFVQNIYGSHDFSCSYQEHLANITRIKATRAKIRKFTNYQKGKYPIVVVNQADNNKTLKE